MEVRLTKTKLKKEKETLFMKEMTVDGIKFTSCDDAISYINEIKQAEIELAESKRIEERTKRQNEIEDMAENLIELIKKYEKDYSEKLIVFDEKVIPKSNEMFNQIERAFEQVNNQFYGR